MKDVLSKYGTDLEGVYLKEISNSDKQITLNNKTIMTNRNFKIQMVAIQTILTKRNNQNVPCLVSDILAFGCYYRTLFPYLRQIHRLTDTGRKMGSAICSSLCQASL